MYLLKAEEIITNPVAKEHHETGDITLACGYG